MTLPYVSTEQVVDLALELSGGSMSLDTLFNGRSRLAMDCRDALVWALHETSGLSYPDIARAMRKESHSGLVTMKRRADDGGRSQETRELLVSRIRGTSEKMRSFRQVPTG